MDVSQITQDYCFLPWASKRPALQEDTGLDCFFVWAQNDFLNDVINLDLNLSGVPNQPGLHFG